MQGEYVIWNLVDSGISLYELETTWSIEDALKMFAYKQMTNDIETIAHYQNRAKGK